MRRLTVLLAIAACAVSAQTKKILVMGAGPDVKEYQSASPKANVIAVTRENVMQEIGDADMVTSVLSLKSHLAWSRGDAATAVSLAQAGQRDLRRVSDAVLALMALGFKQIEAHDSVRTSQAALGPEASVEDLVRASLKKGA